MANELEPVVEQWYAHLDKGQRFYVTAVDEESDSVEIQHFDGDVEEFTFDEWRGLDIELSEEPENWSGSVDIANRDDFGTEITDTDEAQWDEPLQEIHDRTREKLTQEPGAANDDYGEGYPGEESLNDKGESP